MLCVKCDLENKAPKLHTNMSMWKKFRSLKSGLGQRAPGTEASSGSGSTHDVRSASDRRPLTTSDDLTLGATTVAVKETGVVFFFFSGNSTFRLANGRHLKLLCVSAALAGCLAQASPAAFLEKLRLQSRILKTNSFYAAPICEYQREHEMNLLAQPCIRCVLCFLFVLDPFEDLPWQ